MSTPHDMPARTPLAEAFALLSPDRPFATLFEDGEAISVELYAPVGTDRQTPHDRDELYIVASGDGLFSRAGDTVPFSAGDLLFVPAHQTHRFERFSDDFKVWVIFYGPIRALVRPSP
ncbi:cupin domain-containing protein [Methylobrevis pamukkalensis]|uniref:Cupin domain protein n=1 Tax=Methylobrevis pamukkalensis TaxID=1439726 RepID=A0A1E3H072_9HYPH|nr:cupin domain-containing protein [Methylobrevis pamukkalensis]ODN69713.1 Cupin domain protein [Methylobrevis pamukkalensis]